jgi:hypothetical protein
MRLLAIVFSATLIAFVLAHEAFAARGGGIRAGGASLRGVSAGAYRGGALRARNLGGYRAAAWRGRPYWRGGRWYGYGVGLGTLAGASYYSYPYYYPYSSSYYGYPAYGYRSAYSGAYGYSSGMGTSGSSAATTVKAAPAGPGMCGTYLYWKDGKCNDARTK